MSGAALPVSAVPARRGYRLALEGARDMTPMVLGVLPFAIAILFEIGVSFLNAGVRLPTASWGRLLVDTWGSPFSPSRFDPELSSIWPTVFTSLAIFLTVAVTYEIGEAIQRAVLVERRR